MSLISLSPSTTAPSRVRFQQLKSLPLQHLSRLVCPGSCRQGTATAALPFKDCRHHLAHEGKQPVLAVKKSKRLRGPNHIHFLPVGNLTIVSAVHPPERTQGLGIFQQNLFIFPPITFSHAPHVLFFRGPAALSLSEGFVVKNLCILAITSFPFQNILSLFVLISLSAVFDFDKLSSSLFCFGMFWNCKKTKKNLV